jgi:putative ABC transport system substrate-binding protein
MAACAATALTPYATRAQKSAKPPVVGVLWRAGSPEEEASYLTALMAGLRELNYRPGENIIIENRFPDEQDEKFHTLAAKLASLNPNILVAVTPRAAVAMHHATRTIPTVFVAVPDPVGLGLVQSWSKPGGNMTGLSQMAIDLSGKRLELFKEAILTLKRVALLKGTDPTHNKVLQETVIAGRAMEIQVDAVEAASPEQTERAFVDFHRRDIQGRHRCPRYPFLSRP